MSSLVVDINDLQKHHKPNHLTKVRVLGTVVRYDAIERHILIRSISLLSNSPATVKLILDEDITQLENPELAYQGTLVDCYGLYNGVDVTLLSIRVLRELDSKGKEFFKTVGSLKDDPL